MIEITYSPDADAAYISLAENETDGRKTLICDKGFPFFALDLDGNGRVVGIEVLSASKFLPKELLEYALRIKKLKDEPRDFLSPGC